MARSPVFAAALLSVAHLAHGIANPDAEAAMLRAHAAAAPAPTSPPQLKFARDRLFVRQTLDVQTCGFIDGEGDNALYCNSGQGCAYFTTDVGAQFFECCGTAAGGGINFSTSTCFAIESCLAYSSHSLTYSYGTSSSGTQFCGSASQFCGQTILLASDADNDGLTGLFTHYNCEASAGVTEYAYDAVGTASASAVSSAPRTTSPAAGSTSTPSSAAATSIPTSSSTPTATGAPSSGKSTNVGAIAGGVVGGVAGLAIIGAVIGWLVYRKRKDRRQADIPEVSVLPSK